MEPSSKKSKISEESLDLLILNIWKRYENDLRTCKINSVVYERMSHETNGKLTAQEVSLKIRSLREKYRAEKIRMDASKKTSSKWIHYESVQQIIENKTSSNYSQCSSFSFTNIKKDPLDNTFTSNLQQTDEPLIVDMPDFSPIPSPSSMSSENTATSLSDRKLKKRKEWSEDDNAKLINIWEKYAEALRKLKRNSHIYLRIAREMKKFNAQEVHTKINNFIQRYRKEKSEMETSGKPTAWVNYKQVDKIMTNLSNLNTSASCSPFAITEIEYKLDLEFEELRSLKKDKGRVRNNWLPRDTLLLYNIWQKYESELRKTKRNSHVYEKMAEEMNGKYTPREIQTKINNQIQRYRKEKKDMKAAEGSNFTPWPDYQRVHEIIGGDHPANSDCQSQRKNCDNNEQNSNTGHFSTFTEQSQSHSQGFCQSFKVSSSPLPVSTPKSPCSTTSEHFIPETLLNTISSEDSEPLATFARHDENKSDSLQVEILENIKKQTEIMHKLSDQSAKQTQLIENLCNSFEKYIERQAESEKAYMDIFKKILEK